MEVDEVDTGLLEQFSSMQTIDKEELVREVLRLVGSRLNSAAARFYLEMNQWNVHAAVCSFFDLENNENRLPEMILLKDVTIGEGESIPPNSRFVKTWRVMNTGPESWPTGCSIRPTDGKCQMSVDSIPVILDPIPAYEFRDISVNMVSPEAPGHYASQWRALSPAGTYFGDPIWVVITVEPAGTLAITQQFHSFNQLGSPNSGPASASSSLPAANPFGRPSTFAAGSFSQPQAPMPQVTVGDNASSGEQPNSHVNEDMSTGQ